MLEALVSNKLQRCIYLALELCPGKPKRRLMLATSRRVSSNRTCHETASHGRRLLDPAGIASCRRARL